MKIGDELAERRPCFSFEFFAPQTDQGVENLMERVRALRILNPAFVSVTYGAGGSSRGRTLDLAKRIKRELDIEVLAHITCADHTRDELRSIFHDLHAGGIENVLALRGDPPRGSDAFVAREGGFRYATDLIALVRDEFSFDIGAAGYPEKHPEALSAQSDLENLKRKVEAGGAFVTTQLFFDNPAYFRFVERCQKAGITVPIVPGIMPVLSLKQILRFTALCGATLPPKLISLLEAVADRPEAVEAVGIAWAHEQIRELLQAGAPGYHLYILNRAKSALALTAALQA